MQLKPRQPRPRSTPAHSTWPTLPVLAIALAALGGCDRYLVPDKTLNRQLAENACLNRCQGAKDRCDSDAHWDYAQCQAGFRDAWREYRFCNASSREDCGYPFWRCAENLYGYCTNRYWECRETCRRGDP